MDLREFEKLEEKVKELIGKYRMLKNENRRLEEKLLEAQKRAAELEEKLDTEQQKRSEALGRVDEVIKLLEEEAG